MVNEDLTHQALSLPLLERVALAEILWQSIDASAASDHADEEREALDLASRRSGEFSAGIIGRTHDQVMEAARHIPACD